MKVKKTEGGTFGMYSKPQILENCEEFQNFLKSLTLNQFVDDNIYKALNLIAESILIRYESLSYEVD
jgi:hypothetical protein